jgi:chloramphenicol O-acetyltransferase type B
MLTSPTPAYTHWSEVFVSLHHPTTHPSSSATSEQPYLDAETELFKVVNVPMVDNIEEYMEIARKTIANQKESITGPVPNDVYPFSSLPWIRFTHFSHTFAGKSEKSNPMFDWGKYVEKDEKVLIPFAIQVHHSFVDGFHVGKFVEHLQNNL